MSLSKMGISTKVLMVVGTMGVFMAALATIGIISLSRLNAAADGMRMAAGEAVLGARISGNVVSLNRAEFSMAADLSMENVAEAKKQAEAEAAAIQKRLAEVEKTAGPQQKELLQKARAAYVAYLDELEDTVAVATRYAGSTEMSQAQREVKASVIDSRTAAAKLRDAMRDYIAYTDEKNASFVQSAEVTYEAVRSTLIIGAVGGILLGAALGMLIARKGIVTPIRAIVSALKRLANGNLDTEVVGADRGDEVGDIARTMQVFKDNMTRTREMEKEAEAAEARAEEQRRQAMMNLADSFELSVQGIVKTVASAATEMQGTAGSMSANAEQTSQQASAVAAASDQAAASVQTVAAATEELTSSIGEISRQVSQGAGAAQNAVTQAEDVNGRIQELSVAANRIGEVLNLITDIASQTNLLALNATIEAARAGDAGKGFAVVANEVKNLANQTARATDEIAQQINAVQSSTEQTVTAIGGIVTTIRDIDAITSAIASAVEEQSAATGEIGRNIEQAAIGTQEVSQNISGVRDAAGETGAASGEVLAAARDLAQQSEYLRAEVDNFIAKVRAA